MGSANFQSALKTCLVDACTPLVGCESDRELSLCVVAGQCRWRMTNAKSSAGALKTFGFSFWLAEPCSGLHAEDIDRFAYVHGVALVLHLTTCIVKLRFPEQIW